MSGGSFDYLYDREAAELLSLHDDIKRMAEALSLSGFRDAALETERLIVMLEHVERRVRAEAERLAPVWKAMEWHVSGDIGIDDVREAVTLWRRQNAEADGSSPATGR